MATNHTISLCLLLLITIATAQTTNAVDYFVINNARNTPGGARFTNEIGADYTKKTLVNATHFIWNIFQQSYPADSKNVSSVSLFIDDMDRVSYDDDSEIHVSSKYINTYSGDVKIEITGIIFHEMTHVWQWDGNGAAPEGLNEGIADYVRLKSGYAASDWGEAGEGSKWDEGYDVTARFLDYIDGLERGFVAELNKKMRSGYSDSYFEELTGKTVDELWTDYKAFAPSASSPPVGSTTRRQGTKTTHMAIWVSASVFVLVLLFSFFLCRMLRKEKTVEKSYDQKVQLFHHGEDHIIPNEFLLLEEHKLESEDFPLLPLSLVVEATQHFSEENMLGEGGFGPVYRGVLSNGKEIAVKRLSSASTQGLQELKNEVTLIAKLQHKNLVRLFGCCLEEDELLLVYEYMPNKSLDFFLYDPTRRVQLDWTRRSNIINGIARGMLYLHEDSRLKIIHRDLKASNVLLDQEMNPKISDFGMARIFGGNQNEANTNKIVGTYGYMAPEYAMGGSFSVKSDVFSFGVLLLEIISGRKNNRFHLVEQGQSLLTYTWNLWCEGQAMKVLDPVLAQSCPQSEASKCIHIGLLCVQEDPADRPTMSSVVLMLTSDTMELPQPTEPAFSVGRVAVHATESSSDTKICSANHITLSTFLPR